MPKYMLTGKALDRGAFPDPARVVEAVSRYVEARPWIERCIVHVATRDALDPDAIARWTHDDEQINAALEIWAPDGQQVDPAEAPLRDAAAYRIEEIVEKGEGGFKPGPIAGVTLFSCNFGKPGLTPAQVRAGYDNHPLVALKVHVGMHTYVRNCAEQVEPAGADPIASFSVLYFPTDEALLNGLWSSPEGQQAVWADVGAWIDTTRVVAMNARSHAVR